MLGTRHAVFVDAGYVLGQGGVSLQGSKVERAQLLLNEAEVINQLKGIAATIGTQLLRIYWYDGAKGGMTVDQITLAEMSDVKVRLGSINIAGQQKGVDSLIVTDMIDLARNGAIADAFVVTGDGDMRIAVQIAQSFGVRVHLINLEPSGVSLNPQLRQEADTFHEISKGDVAKFLSLRTPKPAVLGSILASGEVRRIVQFDPASNDYTSVITAVFSSLDAAELQKLRAAVASTNEIPPEYDRHLLGTAKRMSGRMLDNKERAAMRNQAMRWIAE